MRPRVLALGTTLLALASPLAAASTSSLTSPVITWSACPASETDIYPVLGSRVSCARIPVPVDHRNPSVGTIDLGLIRVRASRAVERKGAIFINFGGPGGSPMYDLPDMAADWASGNPDDTLEGPRKKLVDHFDLIGIVPRGMRGGWTFECMPIVTSAYDFIPTNTDDANMRRVEMQAADEVRRCNENPFYKYVNTEQNARDMEYVRRALGEPKLNYLGISYGTWLGSWYASMYPEHVGRMVFDSTVDVTRTMADAVNLAHEAQDETLARRVLRPIAAQPAVYHMGSDIEALRRRMREMHPKTRQKLAPMIRTPAGFLAAMRVDDWMHAGHGATRASLVRLIARTRFHENATADAAIRLGASHMLDVLFSEIPMDPYQLGPDGDSVHMATICNDDTWPSGLAYWQEVARTDAHRFPVSNGENAYIGLYCGQWGPRDVQRPDLVRLMDAPPILMVQAEYDGKTPLSGARQMRDTFDNLYLVIARNLEDHGIYGRTRTPCVELAVPRFFLEGALPLARTTSCVEEKRTDLAPVSPEHAPEHTEFWRRIRPW